MWTGSSLGAEKAFPTKCFPSVECVWETIWIRLSVSMWIKALLWLEDFHMLRHITHSSVSITPVFPACETTKTHCWDFYCRYLKDENNYHLQGEGICWTIVKCVWAHYIITSDHETTYCLSVVLLWNSVSYVKRHVLLAPEQNILNHLHCKPHGVALFPGLQVVKFKQRAEASLRRPVSNATQEIKTCMCTTHKSDLSILTGTIGHWLHVIQPCRFPRTGQI